MMVMDIAVCALVLGIIIFTLIALGWVYALIVLGAFLVGGSFAVMENL